MNHFEMMMHCLCVVELLIVNEICRNIRNQYGYFQFLRRCHAHSDINTCYSMDRWICNKNLREIQKNSIPTVLTATVFLNPHFFSMKKWLVIISKLEIVR